MAIDCKTVKSLTRNTLSDSSLFNSPVPISPRSLPLFCSSPHIGIWLLLAFCGYGSFGFDKIVSVKLLFQMVSLLVFLICSSCIMTFLLCFYWCLILYWEGSISDDSRKMTESARIGSADSSDGSSFVRGIDFPKSQLAKSSGKCSARNLQVLSYIKELYSFNHANPKR